MNSRGASGNGYADRLTECCDNPIFSVSSMKYRNDEIIFLVIREKFIYCFREIIGIDSLSSDLYPVLHILSTSLSYSAFSRDSSSEESNMHGSEEMNREDIFNLPNNSG